MTTLITGGLGFIGSHVALKLIDSGLDVVLLDNLSNSYIGVVSNLEKITGKKITFINGNIDDYKILSDIFAEFDINLVIHCAGFKSLSESFNNPILYYRNNTFGTIALLSAMQENNVKKIIFSSSAIIYGHPDYLPIDEKHSIGSSNPYGKTKIQIEQILEDISHSDPDWSIVSLRYFNPAGAHKSGLIGERPKGEPSNIMPILAKVGSNNSEKFYIYGNDYPTPDGTGIRDYIHIEDLADGHLAAINFVNNNKGFEPFNLGTGVGVSVLELVEKFSSTIKKDIPCEITRRREGDVAVCYTSVDKARRILKWESKNDIDSICKSVWKYYQTFL